MVPLSVDELHRLEQAYRSAQHTADEALKARDEAIRAAVASGWTQRQVADATGLKRQRVGQIAKGLAVRSAGRPPKRREQ